MRLENEDKDEEVRFEDKEVRFEVEGSPKQ